MGLQRQLTGEQDEVMPHMARKKRTSGYYHVLPKELPTCSCLKATRTVGTTCAWTRLYAATESEDYWYEQKPYTEDWLAKPIADTDRGKREYSPSATEGEGDMARVDLSGKRVLVPLPLTEAQKEDFRGLVEGAGGSVSFVREQFVRDRDTQDVSLIIGNVPARTLHGSPELEWLQTSSAGYDHYLAPGVLAPQTVLTNATGAYGQAVSEHMLAQLLCLMKKLHRYRDNQGKGRWHDEGRVTSLVGATVLVLGAGDIGTSFARLVSALGASVIGVRRRAGECHEPFARMAPMDELYELLPQADVVASVLPSSDATRGLADARLFASMRKGSYFVNAGRGDLVVSADLVSALSSGHLAGAALDVTSPEPLPSDDPLWSEPNALITPHVAGFWHLQATTDNVVALCRANLVAYLAGEPLRNLVAR